MFKKISSLSSLGADVNTAFLRAARAGNLEKVLEILDMDIDINTSNANGLNALHLASKDGHVHIVTELLKRGANVDAATKKGNTALHIASLAGQEEVVKILATSGASVNVQSQNGFTPLYMAAQENHDNVVRYLLSNGANQSLATEDGFTPLAVAMQQGHDKVVTVLLESDTRGKVRLPALHIAAKKDDCKAAALLLQNDHNPDVTSKSGFTPLHIAAHYGNEGIASLLLQRGADVNFAAKHNITPMHVAAKWGKSNMVSLLLENGGNIESKTRDGLTPLHCAARSGHEQVVDMLLERGAPISAKTKNGLAPLHMASQGDHVDAARILLYHKAAVDEVTVDYLTALHVAAHCGHVRVAKLLLDRKADANARALNGFTPLHIACKKNRIKVVELLLKHGASIEATTESGLTPLHVASFMGCMNIVIYLIQHGANPDVPTVRGETPLHLAARANQTDIVRILLRNGAQVDARAREQQTPLHIASRLGNVDIVVLLLQHGAQADATTKDLYSALHIAAKEGQEEVASVLVEHGASLTATTKKGFTPLHLAAKYGNLKVARLLLQRDAPVDVQGKNGVTPLHVASHYDHQQVALLLLDKGASPQATSKNGYTPLHIAAKKNQMDIATTLLEYGAKTTAESKAGFTPLHLSAQEGHTDMSTLLIEHHGDPNQGAKNGLTPLHLCAQEDRVNVAAILVKNGADVCAQTKGGYTPLHIACHFGQLNMVRFLLQHGAKVTTATSLGYTPLHQAAQQGHTLIINLLLENKAQPNAVTSQGQTALSIAQKLGYISVVETLKIVTETTVTTTTTTVVEEKYKVVAPETMQETFMSDSEDEGGEDAVMGDHSYRYLTVDEMKSLGDDSLPIDVTRDERDANRESFGLDGHAPPTAVEDSISPQHIKEQQYAQFSSANYAPDNIEVSRQPVHIGFLVSFMVDARGGAMRGCRHSGVRVIVPPRKASMPMRVTCRYLKKDKLSHPPPLMEGEALASRILELGPAGAKFLGPVIIEVPHFASLRGKEREIVILRSDNGETWREHTLEATEEAVQEVLNESFDGEELKQLEDLNTNRITRILTTDFPQYFAIVSRVRQEVHAIGPEGGMVSSTVVPQVQAVFPQGALTKKIKVGLQAHPIPAELVSKLLGNRVAVSPIVTVEPRRRKFHKPITLTIPVPQAAARGMINQYSGDTPTLRLLCSITGGTTRAQWEDVTGSTPLTFVNDCVSFTTTVSARFWLMDCRNISDATKMATELYREAIHVPFMAKFVVFAKRTDVQEARLRVFCMTDDREDKTLEQQEHFSEVAKSRDVEVLEGKPQFVEFAGNLVPVTKSGEQLSLNFHAFRENRLPFTVRVKDSNVDPVGRIAFMREAKVAKGDPPQNPICNLNLVLPETIVPETAPSEPDLLALQEKYAFLRSGGLLGRPELIHRAEFRLSDICNLLDNDWRALASELGISNSDIEIIQNEYPNNAPQQGMVMLRLWMQQSGHSATGNTLEKALKAIGRDDIVNSCITNMEPVTDELERAVAKVQLDQSGFDALTSELESSTMKRGEPILAPSSGREEDYDKSYEDERDLMKDSESLEELTTNERRLSAQKESKHSADEETKYIAEEKDYEEPISLPPRTESPVEEQPIVAERRDVPDEKHQVDPTEKQELLHQFAEELSKWDAEKAPVVSEKKSEESDSEPIEEPTIVKEEKSSEKMVSEVKEVEVPKSSHDLDAKTPPPSPAEGGVVDPAAEPSLAEAVRMAEVEASAWMTSEAQHPGEESEESEKIDAEKYRPSDDDDSQQHRTPEPPKGWEEPRTAAAPLEELESRLTPAGKPNQQLEREAKDESLFRASSRIPKLPSADKPDDSTPKPDDDKGGVQEDIESYSDRKKFWEQMSKRDARRERRETQEVKLPSRPSKIPRPMSEGDASPRASPRDSKKRYSDSHVKDMEKSDQVFKSQSEASSIDSRSDPMSSLTEESEDIAFKGVKEKKILFEQQIKRELLTEQLTDEPSEEASPEHKALSSISSHKIDQEALVSRQIKSEIFTHELEENIEPLVPEEKVLSPEATQSVEKSEFEHAEKLGYGQEINIPEEKMHDTLWEAPVEMTSFEETRQSFDTEEVERRLSREEALKLAEEVVEEIEEQVSKRPDVLATSPRQPEAQPLQEEDDTHEREILYSVMAKKAEELRKKLTRGETESIEITDEDLRSSATELSPPELHAERLRMMTEEDTVQRTLAEVRESLEAAQEELIEHKSKTEEIAVKVQQSPSEFEFRLEAFEQSAETIQEEQTEETDTIRDLPSSETPQPSKDEEPAKDCRVTFETTVSDRKALSKSSSEEERRKYDEPEYPVVIRGHRLMDRKSDAESSSSGSRDERLAPMSKPERRSGADFEGWSSSSESRYHSFEQTSDSGRTMSRPCSSDVDALIAAGSGTGGSSEYESALTSQYSTVTSSQDYHTAVSSLSSRESMKSIESSESSGHLASVEVSSETSETLVPSALELDLERENLETPVMEYDEPTTAVTFVEPYDCDIPEHVIRGAAGVSTVQEEYTRQFDIIEESEESEETPPPLPPRPQIKPPEYDLPQQKMKRSIEMTFHPEPKPIYGSSPHSESPQSQPEVAAMGESVEDVSALISSMDDGAQSVSSLSEATTRTVVEVVGAQASLTDSEHMSTMTGSAGSVGSTQDVESQPTSPVTTVPATSAAAAQLTTSEVSTTTYPPSPPNHPVQSVTLTTSSVASATAGSSVCTQVTSETYSEEDDDSSSAHHHQQRNGPMEVDYVTEYDESNATAAPSRRHRRNESISDATYSFFRDDQARQMADEVPESDKYKIPDKEGKDSETKEIDEAEEESYETEADQAFLHGKQQEPESEQMSRPASSDEPEIAAVMMQEPETSDVPESVERPPTPEPIEEYEIKDDTPEFSSEAQASVSELEMEYSGAFSRMSEFTSHTSYRGRILEEEEEMAEDDKAIRGEKHELETREVMGDVDPSLPEISVTLHSPPGHKDTRYPDLEREEDFPECCKSTPLTPASGSEKSSETETDQGREYVLEEDDQEATGAILEEPEYELQQEMLERMSHGGEQGMKSLSADSLEKSEFVDYADEYIVVLEEDTDASVRDGRPLTESDEPLSPMQTQQRYYPADDEETGGACSLPPEDGAYGYEMSFERAEDMEEDEATSSMIEHESPPSYGYHMEYDREPEEVFRQPLEDIAEAHEEYESDELDRKEMEKFKESLSSTPEYDVLAGRRFFTRNSGEHDDISVGSLQEFERLEKELDSDSIRRQSSGSQDSLNGRRVSSRNGQGDDVSLSSLQEFETLESACAEAVKIEEKAQRAESAILSEIEEGHESQMSESDSGETIEGGHQHGGDTDESDGEGYEERMMEIDAIIRQAQTNVEQFEQKTVERFLEMPLTSKTEEGEDVDSLEESQVPDLDFDSSSGHPHIPAGRTASGSSTITHFDIESLKGRSYDDDSFVDSSSGVVPVMQSSTDSLELKTKSGDVMTTSADSIEFQLIRTATDVMERSADSLEPPQNDPMTASADSIELDAPRRASKDVMTTSADSIDAQTKPMTTSTDSLDLPSRLMTTSTDSLELGASASNTGAREDSIEEVPAGEVAPDSDSPKDAGAQDQSSSSGREGDLSSGADKYFGPHDLMMGSTDSLEPSSSTATHATYQCETDSVMSSSFTSGGSNTMVSSTDNLDLAYASYMPGGATALETVADVDDGREIRRTVELPPEIRRVTFSGPDAERRVREYVEQFEPGEQMSETEEVDEMGNVRIMRVIQKRVVVSSDDVPPSIRESPQELAHYLKRMSEQSDAEHGDRTQEECEYVGEGGTVRRVVRSSKVVTTESQPLSSSPSDLHQPERGLTCPAAVGAPTLSTEVPSETSPQQQHSPGHESPGDFDLMTDDPYNRISATRVTTTTTVIGPDGLPVTTTSERVEGDESLVQRFLASEGKEAEQHEEKEKEESWQ